MDCVPFCVATSFFQGVGDLLDMATCFKRLGSRGWRHPHRHASVGTFLCIRRTPPTSPTPSPSSMGGPRGPVA
eukprot:7282340-Heterocapsa_arctica.AAC.1